MRLGRFSSPLFSSFWFRITQKQEAMVWKSREEKRRYAPVGNPRRSVSTEIVEHSLFLFFLESTLSSVPFLHLSRFLVPLFSRSSRIQVVTCGKKNTRPRPGTLFFFPVSKKKRLVRMGETTETRAQHDRCRVFGYEEGFEKGHAILRVHSLNVLSFWSSAISPKPALLFVPFSLCPRL